jgi:hypothetical protein
MTTSSFNYTLPQDNQKLETDAQQAARKEVQDTYPDVYREELTIANHARALCEQAQATSSNLTNDFQTYIDRYTPAYTSAYQDEMAQRDSQDQNNQAAGGNQ